MRIFALAGGSTRDEKPKFLSNPSLSSLGPCLSSRLSLYAARVDCRKLERPERRLVKYD